jgi:hypothetical protein
MRLNRPLLAPAVLAAAIAFAADARAAAPVAIEAREVAAEAGIAGFSHTYGATVADWNDDGWDDALLNLHYDAFPQLHLNDSGELENAYVSAFPSLPPKRDYHGCAAADVDANGFLDLYCTVGGRSGGNGPNPNELWLQGSNGVFAESPDAWGAADRFGRGRRAVFLFANGDELPDLYVTNQQPRNDGLPGTNKLFLNDDGERFRVASGYGLNRKLGGYSVETVDFDLDGRDDLLLCSQRGLRLFRNAGGGSFEDVSRRARIAGACYRGVSLVRMNRDARPDLVRATRDGVEVTLQGARDRFRRKPVFRHRVSRIGSLATGDVNDDQVPDLYLARAGVFDPELAPGDQVDERDAMLASNGTARSFSRVAIPQTTEGIAESVAAIDHDRNGLSDFIVMNGRLMATGPIRLIAFYPAGE